VAGVALVTGIRFPLYVHIAARTTCSTFCSTRGTTRVRLKMQPHMLVKIARITEWSQAELAFQRFEAGVGSYMDLQSVLPGVHLAAIDAQMTLFGGTHIAYYGLDLRSSIHGMRG